jgi:hypothetical protein
LTAEVASPKVTAVVQIHKALSGEHANRLLWGTGGGFAFQRIRVELEACVASFDTQIVLAGARFSACVESSGANWRVKNVTLSLSLIFSKASRALPNIG